MMTVMGESSAEDVVQELQPAVYLGEISETKRVSLLDPDRVVSASGSEGRWTMIYDEAVEVNIDGLSFLAFSRFDLNHESGIAANVSRCGETQLGWYRNEDRSLWGCFYARRAGPVHELEKLVTPSPQRRWAPSSVEKPLDVAYHDATAKALNLLQDWWTAASNSRFVGKTLREMNQMAGIARSTSRYAWRPAPSLLQVMATSTASQRSHRGNIFLHPTQNEEDDELPDSWDWRNVSGMNYLDLVLDQGGCGSCYTVATIRMLTSRHRIRQKDPYAGPFSISFPLYCSEYNQGCDGGYAFLSARWSEDVGLVPKSCASYNTSGQCELHCKTDSLGRRWRADGHRYVGGYYGGSSERAMIRELVRNGPLVASMEPRHDFMYYNGGVYTSTAYEREEWEQVDHAMLLVGYGEDTGKKYWLLQNSWGPNWGEEGFLRIRRGADESGIESIVVAADVVEDTRPSVLSQFVETV